MSAINNPNFERCGLSEFVDPSHSTLAKGAYPCHFAIISEDDGTSSVLVLNLPGAGSCGDTEEEAMENAREAVLGVIESYFAEGLEVPWKTDYEVPEGTNTKWLLVNA